MGKILINPILPVWLMGIICIGLLFLKRKSLGAYIRQILMVILLFVINIRPMVPNETISVETQKLNIKIIFVIDNTISMLADDYKDGLRRLDGVADDVRHIVEEIDGADFTVITFNNNASVSVPFTDNGSYVATMVSSLYPIRNIYAKGTSLNIVHDTLAFTAKKAREKDDGAVAVFFISDGEITDDSQLQSFSDIAGYIAGGAVMGYGTTTGGEMYYEDPYYDEPEQIIDYSEYPSKPAVSKIDETVLNALSKDLGIEYVHMTSTDKIDHVLEKVKRKAEESQNEKEIKEKQIMASKDTYYYFALALLILILWDGVLFATGHVKRKRKKEKNDDKQQ